MLSVFCHLLLVALKVPKYEFYPFKHIHDSYQFAQKHSRPEVCHLADS